MISKSHESEMGKSLQYKGELHALPAKTDLLDPQNCFLGCLEILDMWRENKSQWREPKS